MADRHALLIGVPSCDGDLFDPLPAVVSADIRRMSEALSQSGYEIEYCGGSAGKEPTGNRIQAAMLRAVRAAPQGGVLLVYFSGHGVMIGGRPYLVPQDAFAGPDGPDPRSLVPLVPDGLETCRARLVLFVVDACRNNLATSLVPPESGALPYLADGAFVLLNSCQPGQRSLHGQDGSYFTQALAEVLDRRNPARTLGQVVDAVRRHLQRKAARVEGLEQSPDVARSQRGRAVDDPTAVVICEGDEVGDAWRLAVQETPLWNRIGLTESALESVRAVVLDSVAHCADEWLEARECLSKSGLADPWSAPDYPVRVLATLGNCLPREADLSVVEVALLVAVPFLRETAIAAGLRLAANIAPDDFSRTYRDGPRADLEITHAMYEHVCRRAEGLTRRGNTEARDALTMWLVHRWLADRASLWDDHGVVARCERLAGRLAAYASSDLTARELSSVLRDLMQWVDADPDDQRLVERLQAHVFPRSRALGAALWLAGVMAMDPRRMPGVVVDHVGIRAELSLSALHAAAMKVSWKRVPEGVTPAVVCDHPALYAAFTAVVQRAERVRTVLAGHDLDTTLAGGLPARFVIGGLRPEIHDGAPAFDTPLLRFQLSDDKVRELLMGRQLYGEPDLAIRELYQNALDACRYRNIRRQYAQRSGIPVPEEWTGKISIEQGVEPDGRAFIECADNALP
jgi:hypothetical protein